MNPLRLPADRALDRVSKRGDPWPESWPDSWRLRTWVTAPLLAASILASPLRAQPLPPPPLSPPPITAFEYDAGGNPTRRIVPSGEPGLELAARHQYDPLGRRVRTTDERGGITGLAYTGRDDLVQVIDPRALVTSYARNGLGDLTGLVSPDTGASGHAFDAAGNLLSRVDSRGATASFSYDALHRLRQATHRLDGRAAQTYTWTYDQTGPGFSHGVGRLTSTSYPGGSTQYAYDAQGRLVTMTQSVVQADVHSVLTVQYGYDAAGHVTGIRYPSGRWLSIPHLAGLPTALTLQPSPVAAAVPLISRLEFTVVPGAMAQARAWYWHLAGGAHRYERVHDLHGRVLRYPIGGAVRDLVYDAADRIVAYVHLDASTGTATPAAQALDQAFGYDELGRLVAVGSSVGTWTYAHDANGNRIAMGLTAQGVSVTRMHQVDAGSNRLVSLTEPARTLTHDAAGNVVASIEGGAGWTAIYGPAGRLDSIEPTLSGQALARPTGYLYDAAGLRVAKLTGGGAGDTGPPRCLDAAGAVDPCGPMVQPMDSTTARPAGLSSTVSAAQLASAGLPGASRTTGTVFVYGAEGELLGEYDAATGAVVREYVWLQGEPMAVLDGPPAAPVVTFLYNDHLGAPRTAIDSQGRQRWTWMAEPFGHSAPQTNPLGFGHWVLNLRLPGQYYDAESGLNYNGFRNYAAELGRYTQSDPIGLAGGINTYAYVGGSPVDDVDLDGLQRRGSSNPRQVITHTANQRGSWHRGQFYPALGSAEFRPVRIQIGGANTCGQCLDVYYVASTVGIARGTHREHANDHFYHYITGRGAPSQVGGIPAQHVIQHMTSGRTTSLINPPGFEWHHPHNNPRVVWLVRRCDHYSPTLQDYLHPGGVGGYATFYGTP